MARTTLDRELEASRSGHRVRFELATKGDDAEIRRLLRENPMAGKIALSLEREPDYFADEHLPGQERQTMVARQENRVICTGCCTMRERFINGTARRVGYLGGLRMEAPHAGRYDVLRRGYDFFRQLQEEAPADFYFTSIAADNKRARQFLERGLRGMPVYEFIGEFVTLAWPTGQRALSNFDFKSGTRASVATVNEYNREYQLAPKWTEEEMEGARRLGLEEKDFVSGAKDGQPLGSVGLWDQRSFKQSVVRGYAPWLAVARPALNVAARVMGNTVWPKIGETLASAFMVQLVSETKAPTALVELVVKLGAMARERGIQFLIAGFAAEDPRLKIVQKHFRGYEYISRLYVVRWPGLGGGAQELDGRLLAPEVAWL